MVENKVDNTLFLLGGYDYEMVIIRKLLLDNGFVEIKAITDELPTLSFADSQLIWDTALLKQYEHLLKYSGKIYGIELRSQDIQPPSNYELIDHHNELPPRPAAIEQVITIVKRLVAQAKLPEARDLQLIIANDVAHIKGMKEAGATPEEIIAIRKADRQAQGVTAEDEAMAAKDIEAKKQVKGIIVVFTNTGKFSAITDRLSECEKLLVYNQDSLCYYGSGAKTKLAEKYKEQIKDGIAYTGGAGDGYFGISKGRRTKEEIEALVKEICNQVALLHSVHTFMLPLRWDYLDEQFNQANGKGSLPFDNRTDLQKFINLLTPILESDKNWWERKFYKINNEIKNYNELVYYHAHVTNNIIGLQGEGEPDCFTVSQNKATLYFELKQVASDTDFYSIHIAYGPAGTPTNYHLNLTGISLHVFTSGVAILTYTMENWEYGNPVDILHINQFGRRIYPPFLGVPDGLQATKKDTLADRIEISIAAYPTTDKLTEDFERYNDLKINKIETHEHDGKKYHYNTVVQFPAIVTNLFPPSNFSFKASDEASGNKISFRLLTSDRMFFQCWYGNNNISKAVRAEMALYNGGHSFAFAHCAFWYAFLYGDRAENHLSIANKYLMEEQLVKNTYTRWAAYGTLYGFSKDSFVCISEDKHTFTAIDLSLHMQTMYYEMAVLCLAQRASVLRFSGEVAELTDLGKQWDNNISKRIQGLNLNYIEFINKIYYREITPEIQGIEIYQHFQKAMNIDRDVHDLQAELSELHNFAMMKRQDDQADKSTKLNIIATIFLPASLVASILGIGFIGDNTKIQLDGSIIPAVRTSLYLIVASIVLSITYLFWKGILKLKK